jgi:bacterial/archaeal transporter family protein
MERWVVFSLISMAFAGFTTVLGKYGLSGVSGELGLAIRACFVFAFTMLFTLSAVPKEQWSNVSAHNVRWLALSGCGTALSWLFYYKALKDGEVSTVVLIDKGSFLVAVLLSWLFLKEQITGRVLAGSALMLAGLLVVSRR